MTADSLPSQTAATFEVESTPAADAYSIAELISDAQRHAQASHGKQSPRFDLEAVYRAFGRQVLDERARPSVEAARERASMLAEAAGTASETIALTLAADLVVALAVERVWHVRDADRLVSNLGCLFESAPGAVRLHLLKDALQAPQLTELPPLVALEVQLMILISFSAALEASVWVKDATGRLACVLAHGETATTRRFRAVALRTLDTQMPESGRRMIVGAAVRRWQIPWGALVVRLSNGEDVAAALEETTQAICAIVERDFLLQRSAARERSLVSASERRLSRLGFDLHDGALQHIAALATTFRRFRAHMPATLAPDFEDVENRVRELDRVLRELAHSLEPASLLRRPLERVIEAEVAGLRERTGIDIDARVAGDFGVMTQSQKIAVIRIVQEAFTNIREHSNATTVKVAVTGSRSCVELHIEDDGDGFEVTRTLQDAARRGRLGLVGSSERVRLLGGSFDVRSRQGGPTTVSLSLPRWQPLSVEQPFEDSTLSALVAE